MLEASEQFHSNESYNPCDLCEPYNPRYPRNPFKSHESPEPHPLGDPQARWFDNKPVNLLR